MDVFKFIESEELSRREIERFAGMPEKSFKGEPRKWRSKIEQVCIEHYGMVPDGYDALGFEESQKIKGPDDQGRGRWYGSNRIPGFTDGKLRYRCKDSGLWRRFDGKDDLDGELQIDEVGEYQVLKGLRIYSKFHGNESFLAGGELHKVYKNV